MRGIFNDSYAIFSDFLYRSICCLYLLELHQLVEEIQTSTDNKCFYKEMDKKYTDCNLKIAKFLDCVAYRSMCGN